MTLQQLVAAFADAGKAIPADGKPTVPQVLPLVNAYYQLPGNAVGGRRQPRRPRVQRTPHSTARWNRRNSHPRAPRGDVELAKVLLRMSKTQRSRLSYLKAYP